LAQEEIWRLICGKLAGRATFDTLTEFTTHLRFSGNCRVEGSETVDRFPGQTGKSAPERQTILDFTEARGDGVAVKSAGPYANHLHLAPDR